MKANKLLAVLLAVGAVLAASPAVLAESSADSMTSMLELSAEELPEVTAEINQSYINGGVIESFGATVTPAELENDLFDKALPYMCYGNGSSNRWDCLWKIPMNVSEYDDNDVVYISFYYKSAAEFTGANGSSYTGADLSAQARYTSESSNRYPMWTKVEEEVYSIPTFFADGKWHKVNFLAPASKVKDNIITLYFLDMSKPQYILFAGFRSGVLKFPDEAAYNNDRAYTELGWHLQNVDVGAIVLNGKTVNLEQGVYEYSISADSDKLDAAMPEGSAATIAEVKKISDGCYEVLVAAPGYNYGLSDDSQIPFRRRVDSATGEFAYSGAIEAYTVENSQMVEKYTVNLVLRTAEAALTVDGEEKTALDGCIGGEEIVLDVKYRNQKAENKTYMAVLVIYRDKAAKAVIPAREEITAEQAELEKQYTYELPEGDYAGCTVDFLVIDTETMYDVVK